MAETATTVAEDAGAGRVWLNAPRHDEPLSGSLVWLPADIVPVVVASLRAAAEEDDLLAEPGAGPSPLLRTVDGAARERARRLRSAADAIEMGARTPAEATANGLSTEASRHPHNAVQRMWPEAIRRACAWLDPAAVALGMLDIATTMAWSHGGRAAAETVCDHVRGAANIGPQTPGWAARDER